MNYTINIASVVKHKVHSFAFPESYSNLDEAIEASEMLIAESKTLKKLPVVRIYAFKDSLYPPTTAELDLSSRVVYKNINAIREALDKKFTEYNRETPDWEGTMSYLLDIIKSDPLEFEDEDLIDLDAALTELTDLEINTILEDYGDLEYMECIDGNIISKDKKEYLTAVVDWDINLEDVIEVFNRHTIENQMKFTGISNISKYLSLTEKERHDLLSDRLHHNEITKAEVINFPTNIVLPESVVNYALDERDVSVITEYLSDKYGYCVNEFTLSDELEKKFFKEIVDNSEEEEFEC